MVAGDQSHENCPTVHTMKAANVSFGHLIGIAQSRNNGFHFKLTALEKSHGLQTLLAVNMDKSWYHCD